VIEVGEHIVTSYIQDGQPLIKYRTHDLVRWTDRACGCGTTWLYYPGGVLGRTDHMIIVKGVNVYPAAVEAQGLDVNLIRIGAVVAGSSLMALGGAFLTMSAFNAFFFEMTNGRGWICVALTVFASWRPGKALLGALLFGAFDAFQLRLQHQIGAVVPSQVFLMLPYLLSIAALVAIARSADYPRALMLPYFKGQR